MNLELAKRFLAQALALVEQLRDDRHVCVSAPTSEASSEAGSRIPKPGHVWSDYDVAYELRRAEDGERGAQAPGADPEHAQACLDRAAWHRARAAKMSHIVEVSDADAGWFLAEHLLATKTRVVSFHSGPFDGHERTVIDPPRTMWIAHRPAGEALDQAYLVREICEPHDSNGPSELFAAAVRWQRGRVVRVDLRA